MISIYKLVGKTRYKLSDCKMIESLPTFNNFSIFAECPITFRNYYCQVEETLSINIILVAVKLQKRKRKFK